jgi:hypothetical protein
MDKEEKISEKFVNSVNAKNNVKANAHLEKLLRAKCAKRISKILADSQNSAKDETK